MLIPAAIAPSWLTTDAEATHKHSHNGDHPAHNLQQVKSTRP